MANWIERKEELQIEARKIDLSVILTTKDTWFWRIIGRFLQVITFGKLTQDSFINHFATTFGPIQAYPSSWSYNFVRETISHESRHTYQARICGCFIPIIGWIPQLAPYVGLLPMAIIYLLFPLPIGLAWARYRLELDACIREWEYYLTVEKWPSKSILWWVNEDAKQISSSSYFWSIPYKWANWGYNRAWNKLLNKLGKG